MPKLRTLCEKTMVLLFTSENAAEFLLLADMHHAPQLREAAKHFIAALEIGLDNRQLEAVDEAQFANYLRNY